MRRTDITKPLWGQVDKIGKGTKANYDASKQTITFCFNRSPDTSGEALRRLREKLMSELKQLGYTSCMKYNGEVIVENVTEEDVMLETKNHKLVIHIKPKQPEPKAPEDNQ